MCDCKKLSGFETARQNAAYLTEKNGKLYVVFAVNHNGKKVITFGTEKTAIENKEVCCYYLPSGKEVVKPKTKVKSK